MGGRKGGKGSVSGRTSKGRRAEGKEQRRKEAGKCVKHQQKERLKRTYSCLENIRDCHCEVNESKNRNSSSSITPHQVPLLSSTCPKESTPRSRFSVAICEGGREERRGVSQQAEKASAGREWSRLFLPPSLPPSLYSLP